MRHRAKILSHQLQRNLRQRKEREAQNKEREKVKDELVLCSELFKKNETAENKMFKEAAVAQGSYIDLPINVFKKPTVPELTAFKHVRTFGTGTIPRGKSHLIPGKKGKLEEALRGEVNLILSCYEDREKPIILPRPITDDDGNVYISEDEVSDGEESAGGQESNGGEQITERIANTSAPSSFLSSASYLELAQKNIRGVINIELSSVDENMKQRADVIGSILHRRLSKHIQKIDDITKHSHPALLFTRDNLNRWVALLCFYDQAKMSPSKATSSCENFCLLKHPANGGFVAVLDISLEGSYLYYFRNECRWIRSGKAVGSDHSQPINGLVRRDAIGHFRKASTASLAVDSECFYTLYQTRDNPIQLPNKKGYYEDVDQYCGLSFIRSKNIDGLINTTPLQDIRSDVPVEALFDWSVYIKHLDKSNVQSVQTIKEKQLIVLGYFFELCYDICLAEKHNVSNNLGFEAIIGVFKRNN